MDTMRIGRITHGEWAEQEKEFQLGNLGKPTSKWLIKRDKWREKEESSGERWKEPREQEGDRSRGNFEERVVSSVRHSERSNQTRLKIGSLTSATGAMMIFYWAVSVKWWGQKPLCSQLESGDSECYHFREVLLMKGRKEEQCYRQRI